MLLFELLNYSKMAHKSYGDAPPRILHMPAYIRDREKGADFDLRLSNSQPLSTLNLRNLLSVALKSPQLLKQIAARSYWHPNGFLKLILARSSTGSTLRIHIWRQQKQQSPPAGLDTDIHSHRWPFVSFVIAGALDIHEFTETDKAGDEYSKYICAPNEAGQYKLKQLGLARLSRCKNQTVGVGKYYSIDTNILHQVFNRSDETITIVIQGLPARDESLVFRKPDCQSDGQHDERPLTTDIQIELQRLISILNRRCSHAPFATF